MAKRRLTSESSRTWPGSGPGELGLGLLLFGYFFLITAPFTDRQVRPRRLLPRRPRRPLPALRLRHRGPDRRASSPCTPASRPACRAGGLLVGTPASSFVLDRGLPSSCSNGSTSSGRHPRLLALGQRLRRRPDHPVLDPGQRPLQPPPGQAADRLPRQRRHPGRHRRRTADRVPGPARQRPTTCSFSSPGSSSSASSWSASSSPAGPRGRRARPPRTGPSAAPRSGSAIASGPSGGATTCSSWARPVLVAGIVSTFIDWQSKAIIAESRPGQPDLLLRLLQRRAPGRRLPLPARPDQPLHRAASGSARAS